MTALGVGRPGRVLVWGDVIDDIVVRPIGPVRIDTDTTAAITVQPGGSAANVAAWLGHVGVPVDFVGRVGAADVERHSLRLRERGVDPHLIPDHRNPTGTIVIILDEQNHRTMLTQRGANVAMDPTDVPDALLAQAAIAHFTGYSVFGAATESGIREFIDRANETGVELSVDPGSAGYLRDFGPHRFLQAVSGTTVLLPNLDEGIALTGRDYPLVIAQTLAESFPVVVLTVGARGTVVVQNGSDPVVLPVEEVPGADTTGAGDAFSAGFLARWLTTRDAIESARSASLLAAESLSLAGGRPGDRVAG